MENTKKKTPAKKKTSSKVILMLDWGIEEEVIGIVGKYYLCKNGTKYAKSNPHITEVKTVKEVIKTEAE